MQSHPDRLAVRKASCAVTYQELNLAANRIAFTILAQHEGKAPVVLLLDYDPPTIAAILGVLETEEHTFHSIPRIPRHS